MKKTLLIAGIMAVSFWSCKEQANQGGNADNTSGSTLEKNLALYEQAKENGDRITSIVALNMVLLEDSSLKYQDSLARLYMTSGQFEPGIKLGDSILKAQPDNDMLMEMVAQSKFQLGNFEEASGDFKKLYDKLGKIDYLYQLAAIDFYTQNYNACMKKADDILNSPRVDSSTVDIMTQDGGVQRIGLRAAAHYVRGMVHIARQNAPAAGRELRKALEIEPEFQNAQYQYQYVMEFQKNQARQDEYLRAQKKIQEKFGK